MDDNAKKLFDNQDYETFSRIKDLFRKHDQELLEINNRLDRILKEHYTIFEDLKKILQKVHCGKSANLISDSEPGSKDFELKIARSPVQDEVNKQPIAEELDAKIDLKQSRILKSSKPLVNTPTITKETMFFGRPNSMLKESEEIDYFDPTTIECENDEELDATVDSKVPSTITSRSLKSSKSMTNIPTITKDTMNFGRLDSMLKKLKESDHLDPATIENENNEQLIAEELDTKVDLKVRSTKPSALLKNSKSLGNISAIAKDTMHFGRLDSMLKKVKESDHLDPATIDKCINLLCEKDDNTPKSKRDTVLPALAKKNIEIKHETRGEKKASIKKCLFGSPYHSTENTGLVSTANRTASDDGSIPDLVIDLDEQLGDEIVEGLIADNEDQHLLAPSKVIKSPEAFNQKFFPQDVRNKPLMSRQELAKIKAKKTMVKSKSIGWNMGSSGDNLLQVNQPRRSSLSPERSKEIDQLNAIGKFRNYKNFWENKSQELLRPQEHGKIPIKEPSVVIGPVDTQPIQVGPANKNRISLGNVSKIPLNREGIILSKNLNVRHVSKDKSKISNEKSMKQGLATAGIAKNSEPVNKFNEFAMDQTYARQKMASMVLKKSREDEQGNKHGSDIGQSIRQKRFQKGQSKLAPTRSLDLQYLTKHRKEMAQQGVDISPQSVRDFSRAVLDEKSDDMKALPSPNTLLPGGDGKINQWRAVKHNEGKPALDLSPRSSLRSTDF